MEETVKGLKLSLFKETLTPVPVEYEVTPVETIVAIEHKLAPLSKYIDSHLGDFEFAHDYYKLPFKALKYFSFEDVCKMKGQTKITLDESVGKVFQTKPEYELVRKIMSSMWRWGMSDTNWNEVVQAHVGIKSFSLGLDSDFEVRLDYTTGYNECGNSKFSRTFLDGALAFLVYYKREHVMTIGFSIVGGRKVLVQQVQLAKRTGNRFLFKMPQQRLAFVVECLREAFPTHNLYIVDGDSLTSRILENYQLGRDNAKERIVAAKKQIRRATGAAIRERYEYAIAHSTTQYEYFKEQFQHLKEDTGRLIAFYSDDIPSFVRGAPLKLNGLIHHELVPLAIR